MSTESLIIRVPHELFATAESSSYEGTYDPETIAAGPDEYIATEPFTWHATITNVGDALLVNGTVAGTLKATCARCLDDFSLPINGEIEGYFVIEGQGEAPDDMDDDEFEILDPSNEIDMQPLLNAALLMELPLVPLCREGCLGICQHCGKNLNEGPCNCKPVEEEECPANNPFAVLRTIDFDN